MNAVAAPSEAPRLVTINEAATLARVSRRTIYAWIEQGKMPYLRIPSGRIRIDRETLLRDPR